MQLVQTRVNTHLWVKEHELPQGALWMIKDALSIPNDAKIKARVEYVQGWQEMPDTINLWKELPGTDTLILPRGFAFDYLRILNLLGSSVKWVNERVEAWMDLDYSNQLQEINLKEHQRIPVAKTLAAEQGIYEAPPGSGKTVMMLEAIRIAGLRAIILVDKSNIAEQWRERAKQFLGVDIGLIGDQVWDPKDITVALQQTLWSRRRDLEADGFFDQWGFVVHDECHHIVANTYQQVVQKFPAFYRIGISATPERHAWNYPIALAVLGPVYAKTERAELQDKRVLVKPQVRVVPTDFEFQFRSTKLNRGGYRVQNNYQKMMAALIENVSRRTLVVDNILHEPANSHLVVSKRLNHLRLLQKDVLSGGFDPERVWMLTGQESREERMKIAHAAEAGACVIFSTIADEALDIPRLDRIHLAWPQRNAAMIRQQIGRIERYHLEKTDAVVFDYFDARVGVLKNQFEDRLQNVYRSEGYETDYDVSVC